MTNRVQLNNSPFRRICEFSSIGPASFAVIHSGKKMSITCSFSQLSFVLFSSNYVLYRSSYSSDNLTFELAQKFAYYLNEQAY